MLSEVTCVVGITGPLPPLLLLLPAPMTPVMPSLPYPKMRRVGEEKNKTLESVLNRNADSSFNMSFL